jgi:hypothetical protein
MHLLKQPRIVRRLTLVWLLLVIFGSLQPSRPLLVRSSNVHLGIHCVAFAGAAFLLLLLSTSRRQEICSVTAACLLGLSIEYLQHLIYHISIEWHDVRDDWLAILLIFAFYRLAGIRHVAKCPNSFESTAF